MKKLLIVFALFGMAIWNLPDTTSLFQGQHSFVNTSSIQCEKCHQDIPVVLSRAPQAHQVIGCRGCHTRDGNESHAAKIVTCSNCHVLDTHQLTYNQLQVSCYSCHTSHGGQVRKGASYSSCRDCHTNSSDLHHLMVAEKRTEYNCTDCHPRIDTSPNFYTYVEKNCLNCHNGTAFWANPNLNISVNKHHNYISASISSCADCHG